MDNANTNVLQQSILEAVDTIVSRRVKEVNYDKTIVGTINSFAEVRNKRNVYKINYNGGFFNAIVLNEADSYIPNTPVYIHVPQGDFTKEKIILSKASSIDLNSKLDILNVVSNNFTTIGKNNLIELDSTQFPIGLHSYHSRMNESTLDPSTHRLQKLYSKNSENNIISIENIDNLKRYLNEKSASALMIRADFRTYLPLEQKRQTAAKYGLHFVLRFNNTSSDWGITQWDALNKAGSKIKAKTEFSKEEISFNSYIDKIAKAIKEIENSDSEIDLQKLIFNEDSQLHVWLNEMQALYDIFINKPSTEDKKIIQKIILAFFTELNSYFSFNAENIEDIIESFNEWKNIKLNTEEDQIVHLELNSNKMVGSPLYFQNWTSQYAIFQLDLSNFKEIEEIYFYKDGFVSSLFPDKDKADIFIKNIGFYVLKPLDNISGDYSLKVESLDTGAILSTAHNEEVSFQANFYRKLEDLSQNTKLTYYWFKEDPSIKIGEKYYNEYGGKGWKLIHDLSYNSRYFTTNISENEAYKNLYKCVAVFSENQDSTVIVNAPFTVYNSDYGSVIELSTDSESIFQTPGITCLINGQEITEIIDNQIEYPLKFYWSLIPKDKEEIFIYEQPDLNWTNLTFDSFTTYINQDQYLKNIKFYQKENILEPAAVDGKIDTTQATQIRYPITNLSPDEILTIKCTVVKVLTKNNQEENSQEIIEVLLGTGETKLENRVTGTVNGYRIEFENDNQVFQYDEYGNSPALNDKLDTLKILPIRARLIGPNGLEISGTNVKVDWIFNLENTMIIPPEEAILDEENAKKILSNSINCIFNIDNLYNSNAINNQITCHINFNGEDYYKQTNLFFRKIGENGSNGTDITVHIRPTSTTPLLDSQPLTLYTFNDENNNTLKGFLNDKYRIDKENDFKDTIIIGIDSLNNSAETPALTVDVFQKGQPLMSDSYINYWNLAGNPSERSISKSKNFVLNIDENNNPPILQWYYNNNNNNNNYYNIQIIKSHIVINQKDKTTQEYYGYYPLPIIYYKNKDDISEFANNRLGISKDYYLKEVTYNADGRNPIYNHNQGLKIINLPDWCSESNIKIIAKGGWSKEENQPDFIILEEETIFDKENHSIMIYILPNDSCGGSKTNNRIEVNIYQEEVNNQEINQEEINNQETDQEEIKPIITISAPIIFTLNTFGLASLNAWDGNSVTIDEDGGYIMAPQIGAGEKDFNNRFTGIVMGKTETYTGGVEDEKQIGLFGYSNGLQSIFLDAETGNATFGLPDIEERKDEEGNLKKFYKKSNREASDNYQEGRIELRPGGESIIGGWRIGRKSLYYTDEGTLENKNGYPDPDYVLTKKGTIEADSSRPYSAHHDKDIPHSQGGILLYGGQYPYISIKSKRLEKKDVSDADDSLLRVNDSLELQLDPNTPTLFTIFRHNGSLRKKDENNISTDENNILYKPNTRTFLAGINSKGEFVANTITNKSTTFLPTTSGGVENTVSNIASKFYFNTLSAFNDMKDRPTHVGFQMEAQDKILGQFFAPLTDLLENNNNNNITPTLYLSGGSESDPMNQDYRWGEYLKDLSLHGHQISLYAPQDFGPAGSLRAQRTTSSNIIINQTEGQIQVGSLNNLFKLTSNRNENSKLATIQDFDISIGKDNPESYFEEVLVINDQEEVPLANFGNNIVYRLKNYDGTDFDVFVEMENQIDEDNSPHYLIKQNNNSWEDPSEPLIEEVNFSDIYYKLNNKNIPIDQYNVTFYQYKDINNRNQYIKDKDLINNLYDKDKNKINLSDIDNFSLFAIKKEGADEYIKESNDLNWYIPVSKVSDNIINTKYIREDQNEKYFQYQKNENKVDYILAFDYNNFNWYRKEINTNQYYQLDNNIYLEYDKDTEDEKDCPKYILFRDEDEIIYQRKDYNYYMTEYEPNVQIEFDENQEEIIRDLEGNLITLEDSIFTLIQNENNEWVPKYENYFNLYKIAKELSWLNLSEEDVIDVDNDYMLYTEGEKSWHLKLTKIINNIHYYKINGEHIPEENFDWNNLYYEIDKNNHIEKGDFAIDDNGNPYDYIYVKDINDNNNNEYYPILLSSFNEFQARALTETIFGISEISLNNIDLNNKYNYSSDNAIYELDNENGEFFKTKLSILEDNRFFVFYSINNIDLEKYYTYFENEYLQKSNNDIQYYNWQDQEIELTDNNQYYRIDNYYTLIKNWKNKEKCAKDDSAPPKYYPINKDTLKRKEIEESFPDKVAHFKAKKLNLEIGNVNNSAKYFFSTSIFNQETNVSVPKIKIQNFNMPINILSYEKEFDFQIFEGTAQVGWIALNPNSVRKKSEDSSNIIGAFISSDPNNFNSLNNGLIITKEKTYLEHNKNLILRANNKTSIISPSVGVGLRYSLPNPQILLQAGTRDNINNKNSYAELILNSSSNGWKGYDNPLNYPVFTIKTRFAPGGIIGIYPQYNDAGYSEVFSVNTDLKIKSWDNIKNKKDETLSGKFSNYYTIAQIDKKISDLEWLIDQVNQKIPSLSGYLKQTTADGRYAFKEHSHNYASAAHTHTIRLTGQNLTGVPVVRALQTGPYYISTSQSSGGVNRYSK